MHKIIALDCDEVLASTIEGILLFNDNIFNSIRIQRSDITSFFWHQIPKFSASAEYEKIYRDTFFFSPEVTSIQPLAGAQQGVKALYDLGYDLKIVTNRPGVMQQMTMNWIEKHFPGMFSDIVFGTTGISTTHHIANKTDLMTHIGATCLVDDGLHNCLQVSAGGYDTLLFDNPWNQTETYIPRMKRVKDWQHIVQHFNK